MDWKSYTVQVFVGFLLACAGWIRAGSRAKIAKSSELLTKAEAEANSNAAVINAYTHSRADLEAARKLYEKTSLEEASCREALAALKQEFDAFRMATMSQHSTMSSRPISGAYNEDYTDAEDTKPNLPHNMSHLLTNAIDEPFRRNPR